MPSRGSGGRKAVPVIGIIITTFGEIRLYVSLVPGLGLAWAACSRAAMFIVGCALSLYFVRDYLPRPVNYRFFGKAFLAAAIPVLAVYLPTTLVSDRVITLVPYTILGVVLFLGCAKALKLLSSEDKSYLSHLLPAKLEWVVRLL